MALHDHSPCGYRLLGYAAAFLLPKRGGAALSRCRTSTHKRNRYLLSISVLLVLLLAAFPALCVQVCSLRILVPELSLTAHYVMHWVLDPNWDWRSGF